MTTTLIHFGLAKTATTYLQKTVFPQARGVNYLGKPFRSPAKALMHAITHRHPTITRAVTMRVTAIQTKTERKRQDKSVRRAEKRRRRAGMLRVYGPIRPTSGVCATSCSTKGENRLINTHNQVILKSDGMPLGECRINGGIHR